MTAEEFGTAVLTALPYDPTDQQMMVIAALSRFIAAPMDGENRVFLLNGYAGTGKTSLVAAVVKALGSFGRPSVLLAPTGRAAKVFGNFAGRQAYTIHRRIYRGGAGQGSAEVAPNRLAGAVYIVDEASMIGDSQASGSLLDDLLEHVFTGFGCRLILLGDTAQLPPVGTAGSPAMDVARLRSRGLRVSRAVMTRTVRQAAHSGILYNATHLRRVMQLDTLPEPELRVSGFRDVRIASGEELADMMSDDYAADGSENTILITRSNARATQFNLAIRSLINGSEEELVTGERLMIAKNNYFWTRGIDGIEFLANGEMAVVDTIRGVDTRYGFRFADVTLLLPERDLTIDCKIMLDTLTSDGPALTGDELATLESGVLAEAADGVSLGVTAAMKAVKDSPWLNALQVKYAYAVTCHKAQGGQWPNVYIDASYLPPDISPLENYRWLYTAITRATHRLTLLSPAFTVK